LKICYYDHIFDEPCHKKKAAYMYKQEEICEILKATQTPNMGAEEKYRNQS
jgi:hypothetical protein